MIAKEIFIAVSDRMKAQFELDRIMRGRFDNTNIWIVAIELLALSIGKDARDSVEQWIYDAEFGRYREERIGYARSAEEFWTFLNKKYNQ